MRALSGFLRERLLAAALALLALVQVPLALLGGDWTTPASLAALCLSLGLALVLYGRIRLQERQQWLLIEITQGLASQTELADLLDRIVKAIAELVPAAEKCVIHFLDPTGRRLYPRHVSQAGPGGMVGMPADSGIAGRALQQLQTVLVKDVRREPGFLPLESDEGLRALLVAPLYVGQERLGTLSLNSGSARAFGPRDRMLVTVLAAQASIALYQHRLQSDVSQERRQSELVLESLTDALALLDDDQHLVRYNPALTTILGSDLSDLIGRKVELQSPDPRLQRLAYLVGDAAAQSAMRHRVTIEEPLHAVLEIDVTPVPDSGGRWLRVVTLHDVTGISDALAYQTRLLRAAAHGLQAPLASLSLARPSAREATVRQMERMRQDLLALTEPMEALAMDAEAPIPLRAVLDRLPAELAPEIARALVVRLQAGLAMQRVRGRWLGHLLLHLVEQVQQRSGATPITLEVEGHPEELVFTVSAPDGAALIEWPEDDPGPLGFGSSLGTLSMLVARRLAEALGGYLWTQPGRGAPRCQLILPLGRGRN